MRLSFRVCLTCPLLIVLILIQCPSDSAAESAAVPASFLGSFPAMVDSSAPLPPKSDVFNIPRPKLDHGGDLYYDKDLDYDDNGPGSQKSVAQASGAVSSSTVASRDTSHENTSIQQIGGADNSSKSWYRILKISLIVGFVYAIIITTGYVMVIMYKHRRNLPNFRGMLHNDLNITEGAIVNFSTMQNFNESTMEMNLLSLNDNKTSQDAAYVPIPEDGNASKDVALPKPVEGEQTVSQGEGSNLLSNNEVQADKYKAPTLVEL